jgi:SAM-dependent methyltransferase
VAEQPRVGQAGQANQRWADALAAWAIPDEILAQAPDDPWRLTPNLFPPPDRSASPPDTPSYRRAVEALPEGGTVLDVGAGSGAASLPLAPPAARLVAVDQSADMLAAFAAAAAEAGVAHETVEGNWPEVASQTPVADVVMCHHVFYNVPDLAAFAGALTDHARWRVVVELTGRHPVTRTNPLWRHFWGLERPEGPTADDAVAVLIEAGIRPEVHREQRPARRPVRHADRVAFLTRRLCLPPERQPEVEEAMANWPEPETWEIVTLWWSGEAAPG